MPVLQNMLTPRPEKTYFNWSKSNKMTVVSRCPWKLVWLSLYRKDIPVNLFMAIGSIIHDMIKIFWLQQWESPHSFVAACIGKVKRTFQEERRDQDGKLVKDAQNRTIWDWRQEIRYGQAPRLVAIRDLEGDYKLAMSKVAKGAWAFVKHFWGTPKPPQEKPFRFFHDGVHLKGVFDLLLPRQPDGYWYIVEFKIGNEPPRHDDEATIEIVGWGQAVVANPELAAQLDVPQEIIEELRVNPLTAFKYAAVKYFLLSHAYPYEIAPHTRTPAHWDELVRTLLFWEPAIIEGSATERFPVNRNHCKLCEAAPICDEQFEAFINNFVYQVSLFPAVSVPTTTKKRGASGIVMNLNLQAITARDGSKLKRNRKRRNKPRDDFKLGVPPGGA